MITRCYALCMPPDESLELFDDASAPRDAAVPARPDPKAPLADRMRPRSLDEVLGQGVRSELLLQLFR